MPLDSSDGMCGEGGGTDVKLGERERERERERETERQRDRETERQRDRENKKELNSDKKQKDKTRTWTGTKKGQGARTKGWMTSGILPLFSNKTPVGVAPARGRPHTHFSPFCSFLCVAHQNSKDLKSRTRCESERKNVFGSEPILCFSSSNLPCDSLLQIERGVSLSGMPLASQGFILPTTVILVNCFTSKLHLNESKSSIKTQDS